MSTLLAFPSRIAAFFLNPRDRIAPAVDFPMPGRDSRESMSEGIDELNFSLNYLC